MADKTGGGDSDHNGDRHSSEAPLQLTRQTRRIRQCRMFRVDRATAWRTPIHLKKKKCPSPLKRPACPCLDVEIDQPEAARQCKQHKHQVKVTCLRIAAFLATARYFAVISTLQRLCTSCQTLPMADIYPSLTQCAVVATAFKLLLLPT